MIRKFRTFSKFISCLLFFRLISFLSISGCDSSDEPVVEETVTITNNPCTSEVSVTFETGEATKSFGGNDASSSVGPRNLGTGQSIHLCNDTYIEQFSVFFDKAFRGIEEEVILKLEIRDLRGTVLTEIQSTLTVDFEGGWYDFSFTESYLLTEGEYIFTWYLPDAFGVNLSSGSDGDADRGFTYGTGFSGQNKNPDESLADWSKWDIHPWDFKFRLTGQEAE